MNGQDDTIPVMAAPSRFGKLTTTSRPHTLAKGEAGSVFLEQLSSDQVASDPRGQISEGSSRPKSSVSSGLTAAQGSTIHRRGRRMTSIGDPTDDLRMCGLIASRRADSRGANATPQRTSGNAAVKSAPTAGDQEQDGVDGPTSDIIEAARTNNTGLFKSLLTRTNDDFRVYNDFGDGLLETAASFGHLEILNILLEHVRLTQRVITLREFVLRTSRRDGLRSIHLAAQKNHASIVEALLEAVPDTLLATTPSLLTCVHYASANEAVDALRAILEFARKQGKIAEVLAQQDEEGSTPLHLAAIGHCKQCFRLLVENKANLAARDKDGATPLFPLVDDEQSDLLAFVFEYCEESGKGLEVPVTSFNGQSLLGVLKQVNNDGRTVLHSAVIKSTVSAVCCSLLCRKCPQLLFHGKELPIFTCVKTKNTTVLESLLRATMPLLTSPSHDELSSAAMHFGSKQEQLWLEQRRQEAVVEGILIDHNQRTLLHTAVITNNVKVVTLLLKHCQSHPEHRRLIGCSLPRDKRGCTVMFYVAWIGSVPVLNALLEFGEGQDALLDFEHALLHTSLDNRTAFYIAARNGHCRLLSRLMTIASLPTTASLSLALCMKTVDTFGLTPLHVAGMHNSLKCAKALLRAGAKCKRDNYGRTPLHYAAYNGHVEVCAELLEFCHPSVLDMPDCENAVTVSADENIPTALGGKNTALHLAVRQSRTRVVKLLLDQGAVFSKDSGDNTPFELAVKRQLKSVIAVHLEHDRWREILVSSSPRDTCKIIFETMPEMGKLLLNRFVKVEDKSNQIDKKVTHNLHYLYYHFGGGAEEHVATTANRTAIQELTLLGDVEVNKAPEDTTSLNEIEDGSDDEGDDEQQSVFTQGLHSTIRLVNDFGSTLWNGPLDGDGSGKFLRCYGNDTMIKVILDSEHRQLLLHPVLATWARKKWLGYVLKLQCANLALYLMYLIFLTVLALSVTPYQRCPEFYNFQDPDSYKRAGVSLVISYIVMVFCALNLFKELSQMLRLGLYRYWSDITNIFEWALYILAFFFALPLENPPSREQWIVGSVALFLTWANLIIFMDRMPVVGIFISMFLKICRSVIKALLVFTLFICAFGFSFYILMSETHNFSSPGRSLMLMVSTAVGMISIPANFFQATYTNRSIPVNASCANPALLATSNDTVWLHGQSGQTDILHETYIWAFLLFFTVCTPVVLMNMLIGLAVGDIEQIRREASLNIAIAQTELILNLESKLPDWFLRDKANLRKPRCVVSHAGKAAKWYSEVVTQLTTVTGDRGGGNDTEEPGTGDNPAVEAADSSGEKGGSFSRDVAQHLEQRVEHLATQQKRLSEQIQSLTEMFKSSLEQQQGLLRQLREGNQQSTI